MEEQVVVAPAPKKKHEEKHRKKDPKSWENVSKATANLETSAKLKFIEEKYNEIYTELRQNSMTCQALTKQCQAIQKERDTKESELTKYVIAQSRLENLCRELQKQNKQIKEENMVKIKEEEERRRDVSTKFVNKLTDINNMMDKNKEQSEKLREENQKITAKLKELQMKFERSEDDMSRLNHQMELEKKFYEATIAKLKLEAQAEREVHTKEQTVMKINLQKSETHCEVLTDTVKNLQEQINLYKTRYEDFESTMTKSNKIFDSFKSEMSSLSKQVTVFEKEAHSWRAKWQDSMKAIFELTEVKRQQEMLIEAFDRKLDQLQKLCRRLQTDRAAYLKLLKSNGIEPPPSQPNEDEEKTPSPKVTKKEKELLVLKQNLKALQSELSNLSVEKTEKGANPIVKSEAGQGETSADLQQVATVENPTDTQEDSTKEDETNMNEQTNNGELSGSGSTQDHSSKECVVSIEEDSNTEDDKNNGPLQEKALNTENATCTKEMQVKEDTSSTQESYVFVNSSPTSSKDGEGNN